MSQLYHKIFARTIPDKDRLEFGRNLAKKIAIDRSKGINSDLWTYGGNKPRPAGVNKVLGSNNVSIRLPSSKSEVRGWLPINKSLIKNKVPINYRPVLIGQLANHTRSGKVLPDVPRIKDSGGIGKIARTYKNNLSSL